MPRSPAKKCPYCESKMYWDGEEYKCLGKGTMKCEYEVWV